MPDQELSLSCDCIGKCGAVMLMNFETWNSDPQEIFIEWSTSFKSPTVRDRFKAAWKVLRGSNELWFHSICLYRPKAEQLRDFLVDVLKDKQGTGVMP